MFEIQDGIHNQRVEFNVAGTVSVAMYIENYLQLAMQVKESHGENAALFLENTLSVALHNFFVQNRIKDTGENYIPSDIEVDIKSHLPPNFIFVCKFEIMKDVEQTNTTFYKASISIK